MNIVRENKDKFEVVKKDTPIVSCKYRTNAEMIRLILDHDAMDSEVFLCESGGNGEFLIQGTKRG